MIEIEFSNPVSVMNSDILSYLETALVDGLYEPPIPFDTLAKALRVNPMHSSAIEFKRNTLAYAVNVSPVLSRRDLKRFIQDYLTFGNGYFQIVRSHAGKGPIVQVKHIPALYMRRREDLGYTYKPKTYEDDGRIDFKEGQIFHLSEYDVAQEIYGLPGHVSGLTSIWLNDDATLFRRQYYRNGQHAGYLLYMNEPSMTKKQEDDIKAKLQAKEGMAFKNMFVNARGKDTKTPELKPIGQVEAKDSFKEVKNQTMNDVLALHRVPIELMSVRRESITSLDLNKVDWLFHKNELLPMIDALQELNEFVGQEVTLPKEYKSLEET
ncbi:phage portal protein [Vibrio coralliilyticus OCN008]|uniref:phage portal protein n=1 Tax=Vibrio coralliilyticus TaxID=190893 RepID=UPI000390B8FC|nr:phage portal protein [Vibrio coralliilyticus]ERB66268.1 Presumed portal vertex protein [Vibrio coralliilyticus OCN008]QIJ87165.1 phage portal protein [Vibrio coralliilyticus OCN008]